MRAEPCIGVVAGSGIELEDLLDEVYRIRPFDEIPELVRAGVDGHPGRFIEGRCGQVRVVLQCGRVHLYEGLSYEAVTRPVEAMREYGAHTVLYTNAAGGLSEGLVSGDLMAVTDVGLWPFNGWPSHPEELKPDFVVDGCDGAGRYVWVHGPCYETPAEIRALQTMGGDAVGMSTAPEMQRCRELGLRAGAISCITNSCCSPSILTHAHVLEMARTASKRLCGIVRAALADLEGSFVA